MGDRQVEKIVEKLQKLRALRRARERVRQLERELNGEPAIPESDPYLPEFLRQHSPLMAAK
jgi:predicted component of type VI protein secretion system